MVMAVCANKGQSRDTGYGAKMVIIKMKGLEHYEKE